MSISEQEAAEAIAMSGGKIVSLEFVKRGDGSLRQMICRTGVHSHLKGGDKAYNAEDYGLITVFDMRKNAYRSVNVSGLTRIKIGGEWQEVIHSLR